MSIATLFNHLAGNGSARIAPALRLAWPVWMLAACSLAHAAETTPLTLSDAISEALDKNPEMRAFSADIAAARGDATASNQWQNPELSVSPGVNRLKDTTGQYANNFHGVFSFTQTFEFPGKRTLRRAAADKQVEIRQLALEGFRTQLSIEVRRAFNALLVARRRIPLKEELLSEAKTFLDSATRRARSGYASDFEAVKAEAVVVAAQSDLYDAHGEVEAASAALNVLLGRDPGDALDVTGMLDPVVPLPNASVLVQQVDERNPGLKVQSAEIERAGLSLESIRRSRLPDFVVGPSLEYKSDEQNLDLGITLPLPLWDHKTGEIATATAEQEKALAERVVLRNEIMRDVMRAYHHLAAVRESVVLYTPDFMNRLTAARDAAAQGYLDGRTSVLIYLEAQRTYFETQAGYLDALAKLYDAMGELETAAGLLLSDVPTAPGEGEKH